jgi:hypothetical protein
VGQTAQVSVAYHYGTDSTVSVAYHYGTDSTVSIASHCGTDNSVSVAYHYGTDSRVSVAYHYGTDSTVSVAYHYGTDRPGAHPASCTTGHGSPSQEVKQPGCGAEHPPTSCLQDKERVDLSLYSLSGLS